MTRIEIKVEPWYKGIFINNIEMFLLCGIGLGLAAIFGGQVFQTSLGPVPGNVIVFFWWTFTQLEICAAILIGLFYALGKALLRWRSPGRVIVSGLIMGTALWACGCLTQQLPAQQPIVKVMAPGPRVVVPKDPYEGLSPSVIAAIRDGGTETVQDGVVTLWPYEAHPDKPYILDCENLKSTAILLREDETVDPSAIILGDTVRWTYRTGAHVVTVEPVATAKSPRMQTSLFIPTSMGRTYFVTLRLRPKGPTAAGWYYAKEIKAEAAARQVAVAEQAKESK